MKRLLISLVLLSACEGNIGNSSDSSDNSNNPITVDPHNIEQCRNCVDTDFREQLSSEEECEEICVPDPDPNGTPDCNEECELIVISVEECQALFDNIC